MTRRIFYTIISVLAMGVTSSWHFSSSALAGATLSEAEAQQLARAYYGTHGEWAGKFTIVRFLKTRFESSQAPSIPTQGAMAKAHFQYEWAFLQDPTRTGMDNRYFVYQQSGNGWRVIEMGPHQSGRP